MSHNQYGLSRYIPETIKNLVRRRCGFGCAICGVTITEYEHFHPDFAEAQEHNPDRIVLLCPTHHSLVTKGIIPKSQVAESFLNPAAMQQGFSKQSHPWFRGIPALKLGGGSLVSQTPVPLCIKGTNIISFDAPEDGSEVSRISACLQDASGQNCLLIQENEWKVLSGEWDFIQKGNRYTFKDNRGVIFLQLRMEPPDLIAVETLITSVHGIPIDINEDRMLVGSSSFIGGVMSGCKVGLMIG